MPRPDLAPSRDTLQRSAARGCASRYSYQQLRRSLNYTYFPLSKTTTTPEGAVLGPFRRTRKGSIDCCLSSKRCFTIELKPEPVWQSASATSAAQKLALPNALPKAHCAPPHSAEGAPADPHTAALPDPGLALFLSAPFLSECIHVPLHFGFSTLSAPFHTPTPSPSQTVFAYLTRVACQRASRSKLPPSSTPLTTSPAGSRPMLGWLGASSLWLPLPQSVYFAVFNG